jgi:threonine dehydratase
MDLPTYQDVLDARDRITARIVRTPMLRNVLLDERAGATVLIKPEPLQRTGSFKLRGATNATLKLSDAQLVAGLVTHSSGNHGQAVACAAASVGTGATIFMPLDAPAIKVESTRRWGAEIVQYDRLRDNREALSGAFAERTGATLIPPYDHPDVIAGQGTAALELAEDAAAAGLSLDALLVCTGGGGLVGGCALAMSGASPTTKVIAVEPVGWDDTGRSLAEGHRVANAPGGSMLCDALLAPIPGELTFAINKAHLAGSVAVSDAEVMAAMVFAFTHLKLVVEPGGAVALAAVLSGRYAAPGQTIGVVISGGNVDPAIFGKALAA